MALKLGELLIQNKLISEEQLEKALDAQRIYGGKLGTNLVELGLVKDTVLSKFLAKQLHMEAASLQEFEKISHAALEVVPVEFVAEHKLIPLRLDQKLRVAISDPHALDAIDKLKFKIGKNIQLVIAPEIWIVAAMERYYKIRRLTRFIPVAEKEDVIDLKVTHSLSADIHGNEPVASARSVETRPVADMEIPLGVPLHEFSERLIRAATKEEIFENLFDCLSPLFPRQALFVSRKDNIVGWLLRGFPVYAREFSMVQVPHGQNILESVIQSNQIFRGPTPANPQIKQAFDILRISAGMEIELHPISFRGKPIVILLAVPEKPRRTTKGETVNLIISACAMTGMALEILSLRQQISHVPTAELSR